MSKAIYLFSGGAVYEKDTDHYRPCDYGEVDHNNLQSDGISRCRACIKYDFDFNSNIVITSGAKLHVTHAKKPIEELPSYADIYANELIKQGMSGSKIYLNHIPTDTATEIVSMLQYCADNGITECTGIVGSAQFQRTQVLFDMLWLKKYQAQKNLTNYEKAKGKSLLPQNFEEVVKTLNNQTFVFNLIPAEGIIGNKTYLQTDYSARDKSESNGIKAIKNGNYWA